MPDNDIFFSSPKLPTILNKEDFEKKKQQEIKKQQDKERNDEIDVQMLHDEINSGEIPKETEFYFGCPNQNYF